MISHYIIPQRRIQNQTEQQITELISNNYQSRNEIIDMKVGGVIKKLNSANSLISFAENPNILNQAVPSLNVQNWALLLSKLSKVPKAKIKLCKVNSIINKMLKEIPQCPPGQCSQIAKAAGNLQWHHPDLNSWLLKNTLNHLRSFSPKEFYFLMDGARKLLTRLDLRKILIASEYLESPPFLQELKPQVISCLLRACSEAEHHGKLSQFLITQACEKKADFSLQETVDLVGGLRYYSYSCQEAFNLLEPIDKELAERSELPLDSLAVAMNHFSQCGFVPVNLLPKVKSVLEDSNAPLWIQISYLRSLATLGMKEEFLDDYKRLIESIDQIKDGKRVYSQIWLKDLVQLIYITCVFSPALEVSPMVFEIIQILQFNHYLLSGQNRLELIFPLRALGFFEMAKQIGQEIIDNTKISKPQMMVTKSLENYLKSHPRLHHLQVIVEGEIEGLKVDILVDKLAIEIDGPRHWSSNQPDRLLGRNILRSKALMYAGYEVAAFDLRKGVDVITQEICNYVTRKYL